MLLLAPFGRSAAITWLDSYDGDLAEEFEKSTATHIVSSYRAKSGSLSQNENNYDVANWWHQKHTLSVNSLLACVQTSPLPQKKNWIFFSGGGRGGRRLYTGYSLLTNQLSIGWTLFKLATWRCLPKVSISKTVEIYHTKFLMCFTQGWEFLSFDVTAAV